MNQNLNPMAVRKAMQAADHLAKAARLMREAADLSNGSMAGGKYDFIAWAAQIEQVISCDNGEAGVGPAMAKFTGKQG